MVTRTRKEKDVFRIENVSNFWFEILMLTISFCEALICRIFVLRFLTIENIFSQRINWLDFWFDIFCQYLEIFNVGNSSLKSKHQSLPVPHPTPSTCRPGAPFKKKKNSQLPAWMERVGGETN